MRQTALLVATFLAACAAPTAPSEPRRTLTLPDGVSLASGQFGFDSTTREYVIFLGLRNTRAVPVDVTYGLCAFLVAGYPGDDLSGRQLWSRLLPEQGGCERELGLVIRLAPQSTGYLTLGTVPATVLEGSPAIGILVQLTGETGLRAVRLVEVVVE